MTSATNPLQLPHLGSMPASRPEWPAGFGQDNLKKFHSLLGSEGDGSRSKQPASSGLGHNGQSSLPGPEWIQSIVRQELELWQDSLVYEIRASRDECLLGLEYLKKFIEEGKEAQRTEIRPTPDARGAQQHAHRRNQPAQSALTSVTEHVPGTEKEHVGEEPGLKEGKNVEFREEGKTISDAMALWEISQATKGETDHTWYSCAYARVFEQNTDFSQWLLSLPCGKLFHSERPHNILVTICDSPVFLVWQGLAILANTAFYGFMADQSVRRLLEEPPQQPPDWWETVDTAFTIYFCLEVLFRILAYRLHFFASKANWMWNLFDLVICTISVTSYGLNLNVLRTLRICRVMRLMRVIAQSSYLVELRNLLFSVLACMVPLGWIVLFLAMTFLIFSMVIMQDVGIHLKSEGHENEDFVNSLRYWYEGFDRCFLTLMVCVLGGDWLMPHEILAETGRVNACMIPVFLILVDIGVLNIVIGVFANAASQSKDRHSIASAEMLSVEAFCEDMVSLLEPICSPGGDIHWEQFKEFFGQEEVQAYFAYQGLDTSHVKLIFEMAGAGENDSVTMRELVLGMLRLQGAAKTLNTTIMLHGLRRAITDLGDLKLDVNRIRQDLETDL